MDLIGFVHGNKRYRRLFLRISVATNQFVYLFNMSFWFYSSVLSLGKQSDTFPWVRPLGKWCLAGSISWIRSVARGPPDPSRSCLILLRFGLSIVFGRAARSPHCAIMRCDLMCPVSVPRLLWYRKIWKKTKLIKSCYSVDKGERNQRKGYCWQTTITL